jgi:hypothetical protein
VPLSNALSIWVTLKEIAYINFVLLQPELAKAFHSPVYPVSDVSLQKCLSSRLVCLRLRPDFLTVAMRLSLFDLAYVNGAIWVDQLTITCCLILVGWKPVKHNTICHRDWSILFYIVLITPLFGSPLFLRFLDVFLISRILALSIYLNIDLVLWVVIEKNFIREILTHCVFAPKKHLLCNFRFRSVLGVWIHRHGLITTQNLNGFRWVAIESWLNSFRMRLVKGLSVIVTENMRRVLADTPRSAPFAHFAFNWSRDLFAFNPLNWCGNFHISAFLFECLSVVYDKLFEQTLVIVQK